MNAINDLNLKWGVAHHAPKPALMARSISDWNLSPFLKSRKSWMICNWELPSGELLGEAPFIGEQLIINAILSPPQESNVRLLRKSWSFTSITPENREQRMSGGGSQVAERVLWYCVQWSATSQSVRLQISADVIAPAELSISCRSSVRTSYYCGLFTRGWFCVNSVSVPQRVWVEYFYHLLKYILL
ncbi:hypothetical protein J6590_029113 [Homalodisca vitripennis]|nr:hypothetical protein J6590_029113 [Homalodisca vitripennis]